MLSEHLGCLFNIIGSRCHGGAAAIYLYCLAHIVANTDIVDNNTIILAGILSVNAANRLNQQMLFQRLVVIHISQRRHVKSRDPHIYNDYDTEVGVFLLERRIKLLGARAILDTAKIVIQIRLIVFTNTRNHSHKRHRLQLIQFLGGYVHAVGSFLFNEPFGIFFLEFFEKCVCNLSA